MLHHVELYVSNLHDSIHAWEWLLCEQLGYTLYQSWPEGRSYRYGETYFVFVQTEEAHLTPPYHRKKTGLNHLAFHASSLAQLEEVRQQLISHGFRELYADRFPTQVDRIMQHYFLKTRTASKLNSWQRCERFLENFLKVCENNCKLEVDLLD